MGVGVKRKQSLVDRVLEDAFAGRAVADEEEIAALFEMPTFSPESAALIAGGRRLSELACDGRAEVHAQTAMNVGPCRRECKFCAFAACNHVFEEDREFPVDYVIEQARQFEKDGANAVYLMATGMYPMGRFLERSAEVHQALKPDTVIIANVGDFGADLAEELRQAGFRGIYHAVRLGEGRDTKITVERRMATFEAAKEAGLGIGTCLEPVGPEHSTAELVEKLLITRDMQPDYSGSARRIPIPDTELAQHGRVSEARMAHILAVCRVVLPLSIPGNCTHEPNALGAAAGANLLWAESGGNPRDREERTEEGRGKTVAQCRGILAEAEWEVLDGPSAFHGDHV
ncbi:MAG: radical SAM protein [Candidatus Brocadiia bacterium]